MIHHVLNGRWTYLDWIAYGKKLGLLYALTLYKDGVTEILFYREDSRLVTLDLTFYDFRSDIEYSLEDNRKFQEILFAGTALDDDSIMAHMEYLSEKQWQRRR
jgi:hypothetical protein